MILGVGKLFLDKNSILYIYIYCILTHILPWGGVVATPLTDDSFSHQTQR